MNVNTIIGSSGRYGVQLYLPRGKVLLIKLYRAIMLIGLKDSKDFIEKHVDFDEWLDKHINLELTLTDAQLGRLFYFVHHENDWSTNLPRVQVRDISLIPTQGPDPWDLT